MNSLGIKKLIQKLINRGYEGDYWDYKQEWHNNIKDLIKDIICFANTPHNENCYIIFGVDDTGKIVGMSEKRRKQSDIIDALDNLAFVGDIRPEISLDTVIIDDTEIDVLTVYNVERTPVYLKQKYGHMHKGCIYLRKGDKNTPNDGMADINDIEKLWKKRLGLLQTPLDYIFSRLEYPLDWQRQGDIFYYKYKPEYLLKIIDDKREKAEYYAYVMSNESVIYEMLQIISGNTILKEYLLVRLDGGRYLIPTPKWSTVGFDKYDISKKILYTYFIKNGNRYKLSKFFYDEDNIEHRYDKMKLMDVVLLYFTEEERNSFEKYIEKHQEDILDKANKLTEYSYIDDTDIESKVYKHRLCVGRVLKDLLIEWRKENNYE